MLKIRSRVAGLAAAGATAMGMGASAAQADTPYTLTLSAPPSATVGQPLVIQASGTDPTDAGTLYLDIDEISTSVVSTCPSGYLAGSQLATSTGGKLVAFIIRENLDAAGNFAMPIGYTPSAPGAQILCGYTEDGATNTLANYTLPITVNAAGPVSTGKPRVSRAGKKLTCNPGSWSGNPSAYRYGWLVNGRKKNGAHSKRLSISRGLRRHKVQCTVVASNAAGTSTPVISPPYRVR
jgi:hypothetical protein